MFSKARLEKFDRTKKRSGLPIYKVRLVNGWSEITDA